MAAGPGCGWEGGRSRVGFSSRGADCGKSCRNQHYFSSPNYPEKQTPGFTQSPRCPASPPSKVKLLAPLPDRGRAPFHMLHGCHQALQSRVAGGSPWCSPMRAGWGRARGGPALARTQDRARFSSVPAVILWGRQLNKNEIIGLQSISSFLPRAPRALSYPEAHQGLQSSRARVGQQLPYSLSGARCSAGALALPANRAVLSVHPSSLPPRRASRLGTAF